MRRYENVINYNAADNNVRNKKFGKLFGINKVMTQVKMEMHKHKEMEASRKNGTMERGRLQTFSAPDSLISDFFLHPYETWCAIMAMIKTNLSRCQYKSEKNRKAIFLCMIWRGNLWWYALVVKTESKIALYYIWRHSNINIEVRLCSRLSHIFFLLSHPPCWQILRLTWNWYSLCSVERERVKIEKVIQLYRLITFTVTLKTRTNHVSTAI